MGVYSGHHEKVKNSTFSRPREERPALEDHIAPEKVLTQAEMPGSPESTLA